MSATKSLSEVNFLGLFRRIIAKACAKDVFIDQERRFGDRRRPDAVLVFTRNHADSRLEVVIFTTPPAPYEMSESLGSGGSVVARLKLKGIAGRALPGVEPAALFGSTRGRSPGPNIVRIDRLVALS